MGMFDYVIVRCPNCGADVEFQSKAGGCNLHRIPLSEAPIRVKADVIGESEECQCKSIVQIIGDVNAFAITKSLATP
jgi:hypothetical protein